MKGGVSDSFYPLRAVCPGRVFGWLFLQLSACSQDECHLNALLTSGCKFVWFSGLMINRIMTIRAAALALAAPLLFTVPAFASDNNQTRRSGASISIQTGNGGVYYNTGNRRYGTYGQNRTYQNRGYNRTPHRSSRVHGYDLNRYGQSRREVRHLKREAIQSCRRAIHDEAKRIGFRDVDFDHGRRAYQIGPQGFRVTFNEVEFEGRRGHDYERRVTCTVRQDHVDRLDGIPRARYANRDHRRNRGH